METSDNTSTLSGVEGSVGYGHRAQLHCGLPHFTSRLGGSLSGSGGNSLSQQAAWWPGGAVRQRQTAGPAVGGALAAQGALAPGRPATTRHS